MAKKNLKTGTPHPDQDRMDRAHQEGRAAADEQYCSQLTPEKYMLKSLEHLEAAWHAGFTERLKEKRQ
jgi:hypothetical protein